MRKLIWPVLFLLCLSLQMSLPQNQWFKFDLPLLLIYCLAMLKGAFAGGIAGFFVGLLQDLLTGGIFGFHILTGLITAITTLFNTGNRTLPSTAKVIRATNAITIRSRLIFFLLTIIIQPSFIIRCHKSFFIDIYIFNRNTST